MGLHACRAGCEGPQVGTISRDRVWLWSAGVDYSGQGRCPGCRSNTCLHGLLKLSSSV